MRKNGGLGQYSNYSVAATVSTYIMPGTLTKPVEPADKTEWWNGGMRNARDLLVN